MPPPEPLWWLALLLLWGVSTAADRLWLHLDQRLPSWDQADYLNSAVDHGRALGLLSGGGWSGWSDLLDLSPKIPPLASLVNGTVIAVAGDSPDEASWALALWHGLLLLVVACWARQLEGRSFGLLAAALVALNPALAGLRVDFTLDLPLTAASCLALWRIGCWQVPGPRGGRWSQLLAAALAAAGALLVKQSALLVLLGPGLWCLVRVSREPKRLLQLMAAVSLVLALLLPWLAHNFITAVGGTQRAVLISGAQEGDPSPLSLDSLLWYPRLWGEAIGWPTTLGSLGGLGLLLKERSPRNGHGTSAPSGAGGWSWVAFCVAAGWLFTTLSPNKDARYIAPVLPPLVLLLALAWWRGLAVLRRLLPSAARKSVVPATAAAALLGTATVTGWARSGEVQSRPRSPLVEVIDTVRQRVGDAPTTVLVLPSEPSLNQHNATFYGRRGGGRLLAREVGKDPREHPVVLDQAEWVVLASGDQGTRHRSIRRLSRELRRDPRFERLGRWPWTDDRRVELWRRRTDAPPRRFDAQFTRLARGMAAGPASLAPVFDAIGTQHQLDGHRLYAARVHRWAAARLRSDPDDSDALWSLALLEVLANRPAPAADLYERLAALNPGSPWPRAYAALMRLVGGEPGRASKLLESGEGSAEAGSTHPVLPALADLSDLLSGDAGAAGRLRDSLPAAIRRVEQDLESGSAPLEEEQKKQETGAT